MLKPQTTPSCPDLVTGHSWLFYAYSAFSKVLGISLFFFFRLCHSQRGPRKLGKWFSVATGSAQSLTWKRGPTQTPPPSRGTWPKTVFLVASWQVPRLFQQLPTDWEKLGLYQRSTRLPTRTTVYQLTRALRIGPVGKCSHWWNSVITEKTTTQALTNNSNFIAP